MPILGDFIRHKCPLCKLTYLCRYPDCGGPYSVLCSACMGARNDQQATAKPKNESEGMNK